MQMARRSAADRGVRSSWCWVASPQSTRNQPLPWSSIRARAETLRRRVGTRPRCRETRGPWGLRQNASLAWPARCRPGNSGQALLLPARQSMPGKPRKSGLSGPGKRSCKASGVDLPTPRITMNLPARHLPPSPCAQPRLRTAGRRFRSAFCRIAEGALEREPQPHPALCARRLAQGRRFGARAGARGVRRQRCQPAATGTAADRMAAADSNLPQACAATSPLSRTASTPMLQRFKGLVRALRRRRPGGQRRTEIGTVRLGEVITRVSLQDGEWRLNGTKYYSTGSLLPTGSTSTPSATTPARRHRRHPHRPAGVRQSDDWDGFGQRTTASGTSMFENVRVAPENVIDFAYPLQIPDRLLPAGAMAVFTGSGQAAVREFAAKCGGAPGSTPWQRQCGQCRSPGCSRWWAGPRPSSMPPQARPWPPPRGPGRFEAAMLGMPPPSTGPTWRRSWNRPRRNRRSPAGAAAATSDLFNALGASATSSRKGLDRHWRNARTAASHNPLIYKEASSDLGDRRQRTALRLADRGGSKQG